MGTYVMVLKQTPFHTIIVQLDENIKPNNIVLKTTINYIDSQVGIL